MNYTSNYNFKLPEGTDIVNPLVDNNPNWSDADTIIKGVSDKTVDTASCVKTGTLHAVTRTDSNKVIFKFTATGNWNTGDTMSVDGTTVSVFLQNGEAPLTGAYVINTEVLAIISGTRVTLFASPNIEPSASVVSYDNTASGLTAVNAQDAIDEVDAAVKAVKGLAYVDITDNTDSIGRVTISSATVLDNNFKIIAAEIIDSHNGFYAVCAKRYAALDSTVGSVYFKSAADNSPLASTEITFRLWYADI